MDMTGPSVSDADVRELENMLGTTLPDDYRAFLLDVNGGRPGPDCSLVPLPREDVLLRDLHSLSTSGAPFDLASRIRRLRTKIPYPLIPIGSAGGAKYGGAVCLCLEGRMRGSVWYFTLAGDLTPSLLNLPWQDFGNVTQVADDFLGFVSILRPLAS